MSSFLLSEGDKFKVHGYIAVSGLDNGEKYVVRDCYKDGSRHIYAVEPVNGGVKLRINKDELEPYIGSKTYIETLKSVFDGYRGYISVI